MDDSESELDALRQRSLNSKAAFVTTQLEIGLTFCSLARNLKYGDVRFAHRIENAREALATAEKHMWSLRMDHSTFDRMTALAERLRLELKNMTSRDCETH
jgi:hypothetical protein